MESMDESLRNFSLVFEDKIAGSAHPGSGATLAGGLALLREKGFRAIISLTETTLDIPLLREFEFDYRHLPVMDFQPPSLEQIVEAVNFMEAHRKEGSGVLVHCAAGQGRTGTILAAYLVATGLDAEEAIRRLRRLRPGSIETAEQEKAIHAYERHLKETARKKND